MQVMMALVNAALLGVIGFYAGRLIAMTVHYLPQILLEGCDQGREPRDIFTWFFQKKEPVHYPYQYGVAAFFALSTLLFGLSPELLFVLFISCLLLCCFMTDYEHGILPDQLTLTLVWAGLIGSLFPLFVEPSEAIIGAVAGYGIFWFFNEIYRYFRKMEGMYPGDFKLSAGIGACIGLRLLIPILIASLIVMIVVTLLQQILGKKDSPWLTREVPYACFSSIVFLLVLFYKLAFFS